MVTSSSRPATGKATNGSVTAIPVLDPAV
ncbi:MAG: hypothetical protein JWP08_4479, partial [Bryobacterales bacterium]|nr:hypothetical protein [Bryobacterales bacterium]